MPLIGDKGVISITVLEKRLLLAYIYNNRCRLENNVRQLQLNIRYRHIDSMDAVEVLYALQELENFNQVTKDIIMLLKLK